MSRKPDPVIRARILRLLIYYRPAARTRNQSVWTRSALADVLGFGPSTLAKLVDRMISEGLIVIPERRNNAVVYPTPEGFEFSKGHSHLFATGQYREDIDSAKVSLCASANEAAPGATSESLRTSPSSRALAEDDDVTYDDLVDDLSDEDAGDPEPPSALRTRQPRPPQPSRATAEAPKRDESHEAPSGVLRLVSRVASVVHQSPRRRMIPNDPPTGTPEAAMLLAVRVSGWSGDAAFLARIAKIPGVGEPEALVTLQRLERARLIKPHYWPDKNRPPLSWKAEERYGVVTRT